jgi:hypothetical protein
MALIPSLMAIMFSGVLPIGRLAVVKDQAGKGRIVAITNYFIQLCLYPLHRTLFHILSKIKTDGTFDQRKPLEILVERIKSGELSGHKYSCFDLSAATDRLPVDVQCQVLTIIFGKYKS